MVPKTMQEVFDKHLHYEIARLEEMYLLLLEPETYNKPLPEPVRDTIKDALIVGFCIHAKNLVEFLSKEPRKDRAVSVDYAADGYQSWNITHGTRKLNNQISHLSYERTDEPTEKIRAQEQAELVGMIYDELCRWSGHLKSEYDANKLNLGALATAREKEIRPGVLSATTHTTSSINLPFGPSRQGLTGQGD